MSFNWTCPYCNHAVTISKSDRHDFQQNLPVEGKHGYQILLGQFLVCPNSECKEFTLGLGLANALKNDYGGYLRANIGLMASDTYKEWRLVPESNAIVFPDYIPEAILNDYKEACLIKDKSPKASATLSRRCLQGMIRDFWEEKESNLAKAIKAIKSKVDTTTWSAIDAVRSVGNIGAHMEKDINLIVEVEPNEAALLIELIETLLNEWYVARHERQQKMESIIALAKDKKEQKKTKADK